MATNIGAEGAIDTAFAGGLKGAGAMLPKARSFVQSSPLSKAGEAVSTGAQGAGGVVKGGTDFVQSLGPTGKDLALYYNPLNPASNATFMSSLARAPRGAVTMGAEGLGKLGKSERFAKMFGDDAAAKVGGFSEEIMQRPAGEALQASHVLGNLGRKAGRRLRSGGQAKDMEAVMAGGVPSAGGARAWAEEGLPRVGESFGRGLHALGQAGQTAENFFRGATDMGVRGIGAAGSALQSGGKMGRAAFKGIAPAEPWGYYGAARAGLDSAMPESGNMSEEQMIFNRWQKQRRRNNIGRLDHI